MAKDVLSNQTKLVRYKMYLKLADGMDGVLTQWHAVVTAVGRKLSLVGDQLPSVGG